MTDILLVFQWTIIGLAICLGIFLLMVSSILLIERPILIRAARQRRRIASVLAQFEASLDPAWTLEVHCVARRLPTGQWCWEISSPRPCNTATEKRASYEW